MNGWPRESFGTLRELEAVASRKVTDHVWAYIQGGSGDEETLASNREAFRKWVLVPRVLVDVSSVDLRVELLGRSVAFPFFVAPMAYQQEVHPEGEVAVARATSEAETLGIYSTLSSCSLEEIAAASGDGPRWFQLYLQPDFEISRSLVQRAENAGYSALVLTVDAPVLAVRDRQTEAGFAIDSNLPVGNGRDVVPPSRAPVRQGPEYRLRSDAAATWSILDQLRRVTRLPIVVKGILNADDAQKCAEHGARAIIVSNHGGRQLAGVPAALDALPEIVKAVGARVEVLMDGGVRRARDVLTALALGARAVGIGRPVLWALAADGTNGVRRYLSMLGEEVANSMALAGCRSRADVARDLVRPA